LTKNEYAQLVKYIKVKRPDLDPILKKTLVKDKAVFDRILSSGAYESAIKKFEVLDLKDRIVPAMTKRGIA
jgi:hypothetical protein